MEALGQIIVYLFFSGIAIVLIVLACIVGIVLFFIKSPKESTRLFLSFISGAIFTSLVGYFTRALWLNLDKNPELAVGGLFVCLILTLIISYVINTYLSKK